MNRKYTVFLVIIIGGFLITGDCCDAATVGNPLDMDVPRWSLLLRQQIVENTLDEYEQIVKVKSSVDAEFVFDKDLHTTSELTSAELEGQYYMVKFGATLFERIEPYLKVGTSNLEVKWNQGGQGLITVDADYGFAWGGGIKGVVWEFKNWGIRLTGDVQYRSTEPDVIEITRMDNIIVNNPGADFKVDEWQTAIVLSKKFELPLKWQSIFIIPYTGLSISDSTVDVKFTNPDHPSADFSLFDANNDSIYGFLLGCDIMPALTSSFIYSIECRLINEFSLTLGGALKF